MTRKLFVGFAILLAATQLVPFGRDHSNPPVVSNPNWNSPEMRTTFMRVCANCHSHETKWPWYSHVAPASWLVQKHVDKGRANFNISQPGADDESDKSARMVEKRRMPPRSYLWGHPEARLTDAERATFASGLAATFGTHKKKPDVGEKSGYLE